MKEQHMSNANNIWENENNELHTLPDGWSFVDFGEAQFDLGDNVVLSVAPKYLGRGAYSETQWNLSKVSNPFSEESDELDLAIVDFHASDWTNACEQALKLARGF
jgi:hypothetical protein